MSQEPTSIKQGLATALLIGLALAIVATIIGTSDPYADELKRIRQSSMLTRAAMPTKTPTPTATLTPTPTSTPTLTPIYDAPVANVRLDEKSAKR